MNTILSIDFDFWAEHDPAKHDWGHSDTQAFLTIMWHLRAAEMMRDTTPWREVHLPHDEPRPAKLRAFLEDRGWDFCKADLWVVESHADIAHILDQKRFKTKPVRVVNIDAHCDLGYAEDSAAEEVACDNWGEHFIEKGYVREFIQIYPKWRHRHFEDWRPEFGDKSLRWAREYKTDTAVMYGLEQIPMSVRPSHVFICRSGAWSPPWLDGHFVMLARSFAEDHKRFMTCFWQNFQEAIRHTDWSEARRHAAILNERIKGWALGTVSVKQWAEGMAERVRI